jgi:hypothetical protein
MAILRGTDVMRDSSVIAKRIGRKGCARRSPRNDKQGEFLRGRAMRDSSTALPSGRKSGPTKLHLAATLRMPQALKQQFWLEKR